MFLIFGLNQNSSIAFLLSKYTNSIKLKVSNQIIHFTGQVLTYTRDNDDNTSQAPAKGEVYML